MIVAASWTQAFLGLMALGPIAVPIPAPVPALILTLTPSSFFHLRINQSFHP